MYQAKSRSCRSVENFGKNYMNCLKLGILVELKHLKAHRTKKEKENMTQFEMFVTGGNEKADDFAKAGAMLDEGLMAEAGAKTMQQEREEVFFWLCSLRPASFAW